MRQYVLLSDSVEMKKYGLQLRTAFNPPYVSGDALVARHEKFHKGFAAFFKHYATLKENGVYVYLLDNTIMSADSIPPAIRDMLLAHGVELFFFDKNELGAKNKGAGEIEGIQHMRSTIKDFEWFIHLEPRQELKSFYFLDSFFANPRNLFFHNGHGPFHFHTGLYTTEAKNIISFVDEFSDERLRDMVYRNESIEYLFCNFYQKNEIKYDMLDKMDLIWHAPEGREYHW